MSEMNVTAPKKVGMCTGVSRLDDAAFIFSAWNGIKRAREAFDIDTTVIESEVSTDDEKHLRYLADSGYDLVWAVGYDMQDTVLKVAPDYPDVAFGVVDVVFDRVPSNVVALTFREQEGAFLAGYAAAKTSRSRKVGFVGGKRVPLIEKFRVGFEAGVAFGDESVETISAYADSFLSYRKGQELAQELYDSGVDIIFAAAGTVGKGIIRYAKEHDGLVIGVDLDQSFLAPGHVLTSMIKDLDGALYRAVEEFLGGSLKLGSVRDLGLADRAVNLAPLGTNRAPAGLDAELAALRDRIVAGDIAVATV